MVAGCESGRRRYQLLVADDSERQTGRPVGGVAAATQRGAGGERNPLVTDAWAREVLLGLDPFLLLFEFELNFNNSNDIL
jgi:hypothetical protein